MVDHTLRRHASTPFFQIDYAFGPFFPMNPSALRRTASAQGLELGPFPWELATVTTTTTSPSDTVAGAATTTDKLHLRRLHNQLAANFQQLVIAIEQIKTLEAQLVAGQHLSTRKTAKLERKLAGHVEHRDSLGTQRRRLLGKTGRAELSQGWVEASAQFDARMDEE
ncbi:hypothetical protein MMC27_003876 [Xylographa pallens]|nr:hypothetical protein [Xylographa pallens]